MNVRFVVLVGACSLALAGGSVYAYLQSVKAAKIEVPLSAGVPKVDSFVPLPTPVIPTFTLSVPPPDLTAQSFVVYDVATHTVVTGKNPRHRLMPASTTKMMTALVAVDEYAADEVVTVARAAQAVGHTAELQAGEQMTVANLIKAMMVNSGNDAAFALADHHPAGYSAFVELMNRKARSFGLKDTHFSNVSGVEADDHYSSAADLAVIASILMENPILKSVVGTKTDSVQSISGSVHSLENLNQLLWDVPGVIGVKTGWTENAGDCLATYISRDRDYITVVLKSEDRFADSTALIEWVYSAVNW